MSMKSKYTISEIALGAVFEDVEQRSEFKRKIVVVSDVKKPEETVKVVTIARDGTTKSSAIVARRLMTGKDYILTFKP